jgi:DNA-binding transcriptional regulator YiaG
VALKSRCPACGSTNVHIECPKDYHHTHCGLTGIHLLGVGVTITDCTACRQKTTTILQEAQLLQVLGMAIVTGKPGLTGEQLRYLRKLFEMTQGELADSLGKGRRETVAEWEAMGRKRLFKTPYEEIGLRAVLMSLFAARVLESEFNCLSPQHKAEYANAAGTFVERVSTLLAERGTNKSIEIRRQSRRADWSATHCSAC